MPDLAIRRTTCRGCGGPLDKLLDLGSLYLSTFLGPEDPLPPTAPLELTMCRDCDLVQLRHTVQPDKLFRHYWYKSAINEAMREELANVVRGAINSIAPLTGSDVVIDIGANDGTLLSFYPRLIPTGGPLRVAFEPAKNLYVAVRQHADVLIADYFPQELQGVKAKIISSVAMFYDLDDPHSFLEAVQQTLHPEGVWVVQFQDLLGMVEATAYDNLCFEHLVYYSLGSFETLVAQHGLRVVRVERRAINGGSLRLYVQHDPAVPDRTVEAQRHLEADLSWDTLQRFAWASQEHSSNLRFMLTKLRERGHTIDLYGASTKTQTLLQYAMIGPELIRWGVERSPEKFGRKMVTGIPIVPEEQWREDPGQYILVGIWGFKEAILQREADYLRKGGSFIFPLPALEIVQ